MISLLNMEYFIVVTQERSFTAAAKKLFISQQTICSQIAQMEKELDAKLFERTRPLVLTPAGVRFYKCASETVFMQEQMRREIHDMVEPSRDTIRIGISHAYARALLPQILGVFCVEYPAVDVKINEMSFEDMNNALSSNEVDFIFSRPANIDASTHIISLYNDDSIYLYAPEAALQRIYGDKAREIRASLMKKPLLSTVKDCPFVLPFSGSVRLNANRLFSEAMISPRIPIETNTLETAIILCSRGMGLTFSPGSLLTPYTGLDVFANPEQCYLLAAHRREHTPALCYKENAYLTKPMQRFIQIASR